MAAAGGIVCAAGATNGVRCGRIVNEGFIMAGQLANFASISQTDIQSRLPDPNATDQILNC
jgi:hypothetical protein